MVIKPKSKCKVISFGRLYHQCKVLTRLSQGASYRSVCSKTVIFLRVTDVFVQVKL